MIYKDIAFTIKYEPPGYERAPYDAGWYFFSIDGQPNGQLKRYPSEEAAIAAARQWIDQLGKIAC